IFGRLPAEGQPSGAQVDLTPIPTGTWPTTLWPPLEAMRTNWKTYAGSIQSRTNKGQDGHWYQFTASAACTPSGNNNSFCDAILQARDLLLANYDNYRNRFSEKCPFGGTPIDVDNNKLVAHVYGWAPWTEAREDKKECKAGTPVLLLQNTPGYWT